METESMHRIYKRKLRDFKGSRALITGGLGFIGSNLAVRLNNLGVEVRIVDNLDPNAGGHILNDLDPIAHTIFGDICDSNLAADVVADVDYVFHCAASTSHPLSMRFPSLDADTNIRGTLTLLEAIRRFSPNATFFHFGTTTQMGAAKVNLIIKDDEITPVENWGTMDELSLEKPADFYSAHKVLSEKYVDIYGRFHGLNIIMLRIANTYGPRAAIHTSELGFMNYFIGLGLQSKQITVYGNGDQYRNTLYVDDVIEAIVRLAVLSENCLGELYILCHTKHYRVIEIAQAVSRHIGGEVRCVPWPDDREKTEVGHVILDGSKLHKAIEWSPQNLLDGGLQRTREWYRRNNRISEYLR